MIQQSRALSAPLDLPSPFGGPALGCTGNGLSWGLVAAVVRRCSRLMIASRAPGSGAGVSVGRRLALVACAFAAMTVLCLSISLPAAGQSCHLYAATGPQYQGTADTERVFGYTSMAIAPNGTVHIACGGKKLVYVAWDGESWSRQQVEAQGTGEHCSLALDGSGYPAISYHDSVNSHLKYAHWNGSAWDVETVDSQDWAGKYTSLAFDAQGHPAISYYKGSWDYDLKYAHWNGSAWDIETVDGPGTVGWHNCLAFDGSGSPAISYHDARYHKLKYASWDGSAWDIEIAGEIGGGDAFTSLAFDDSGNPAISCYRSYVGYELWYAHRDGASWSIEVVDDMASARDTSLAFDSSGHPAISYCDGEQRAVKLARWNGDSWSREVVIEEIGSGWDTSLAFDSSGYPVVSSYGAVEDMLKLSRWDGTSWAVETLERVAEDTGGGLFDCACGHGARVTSARLIAGGAIASLCCLTGVYMARKAGKPGKQQRV